MPVTLDAALSAAQSNQSRRPLCRIYSLENADPIPFDGELLSTATPNEQHPDAKMHSTGRLFVAYAVDGTTDIIRYGYTDTSRTFFTYVDLTLAAARVCGEVSVCEMADAYVGLIWEETYGGTRSIKYRKITVTGVDPTPAVTGTIFTQATTAFFTGPAVACLADDSYIMVYGIQDGDSHYHLYRRTSADFVTWSAASEIDLSGLTDANRKANPYLIEPAAGTLWLLFDYVEAVGPSGEELTNAYYVSSSDKLATASAATALTNYTTYSERAAHPTMAQTSASELYLVFDRLVASLKMDKDSTGWCGLQSPISNMHIDATAQKLYAVSSLMGVGDKTLYCVVQIDLATWTIDKCWSTTTVPAFPAYFANTSGLWQNSCRGDGHYVPLAHENGLVSVLNAQADTITTYAFYDLTAYGHAQNVTWTPTGSGAMSITRAWVDAATDRLYVALARTYLYSVCLQIGWIDLTAAGPGYTFTTIVSSVESGSEAETRMQGFVSGNGFMEIVPADGWIIVGMEGTGGTRKGCLRIYDLATGGLWKEYSVDSNPSFPYRGLKRGVWNDGLIVGPFTYEPLYGQVDYRGLCFIDTATDVITYQRPPWASVNDYGMKNICLTDDGEYIVACNGYGVTLLSGSEWTLFSNDTLPGMTTSGEDYFNNPVVYNPTTRMIIAGHGIAYGNVWSGLVMFSRDGYIKQATYRIGTLSGTWSWATAAPLVIGYTDYEAVPAVDPDDGSLYAFWVNQNGTELSIKWDKALPAFDLSSYLVRGETVERSATIDPATGNWDAGLSFTVSHGHLFDPSNAASLLRIYLQKGRRLQQQFGDKVAGVDYWEPARIFTVSDDGELDYERGEYPVMRVEAETPRRRWEQIHIVNSVYYSTTPELMIADLLQDFAGILPANISLGTWPNSATVDYQFVDVMLGDAVDMIAAHFGYAIRDGETGIIEAVKITDAAAVDRTYSDNTKLIRATPRNRYSSFTNRWVVESEEKTFTELLMAEELAAEFNASHRWNTGNKTYRINYTQGSKIYRNPRMEVVQSVEALAFSLAGGCSENLIDNSHDEVDQALWDTYCHINVDSPDLTWALIAALAALAVECLIPDGTPPTPCAVDPGTHLGFTSPSETIPLGRVIAMTTLIVALNILAATGNFQYKIHGQPVVKVRRKISGEANDTEMQVKMAQIISEQPFQDPLCASPAECQAVADYRRMVGMGERRRWSAEMVADLRVEDGDTLTVVHPVSGDGVTVFLTDLKMAYVMPEGDSDSGGFTMSFEGWRR